MWAYFTSFFWCYFGFRAQIPHASLTNIFFKPEVVNFDDSIEQLSLLFGVQEVRINSTLASHANHSKLGEWNPNVLPYASADRTGRMKVVTREMKKKTLIVYYIHKIDKTGAKEPRENWDVQFNDALSLLQHSLAFEVFH